jgi:hypothetical protein
LIQFINGEPRWLKYSYDDGWNRHCWQLGQYCRLIKDLGDLEKPLLKIVTEELRSELETRFQAFRLSLHPEKTRLLEFGRFAQSSNRRRRKPETFNFLGFTHICGKTRKGRFTVFRRTMKSRLHGKIREVKEALRRRMHRPTPETGAWLKAVVRGHYQYYGVPGNYKAMNRFRHRVLRLWHRTLRRRSQKDRCRWAQVKRLADRWVPLPRIVHPYPSQRLGIRPKAGAG